MQNFMKPSTDADEEKSSEGHAPLEEDIPDFGIDDELPIIEEENLADIDKEKKQKRRKRKVCMLYPNDSFKKYWDIIIALTLVLCALIIPYRVAMTEEDSMIWVVINYIIDFVFLIDILVVFFSAYRNEDFMLIHDRKKIAV